MPYKTVDALLSEPIFIKGVYKIVSLNCCDELHLWKQVFDGTELVKELYGHPIRE
jgi:hypothetical protein